MNRLHVHWLAFFFLSPSSVPPRTEHHISFFFLEGAQDLFLMRLKNRVRPTGSGTKLFLGHRFPLAYVPPFTFEGISALSYPPLFTLQNRSSFVLSYGRGIPHVPNYNNPPRHESGHVLLSPPFHMVRPSHLKLGRAGVPLATTLRRLQLMQIFSPEATC